MSGPEICTCSISEISEPISRDDMVDPRVQVELERLNTATDLINKLEIELDEARSHFRHLLNESSMRVNQLAKKLGSCVERARPYYEARMQAKQLQTQTQKAALRYERASSAHSAAKEMVYLAEEGLKKEGRCFDPAWQEMLNHATLRVNEAESERVHSQHEHQKTSLAYNEAEKIVQQLHQELKRAIVKSSLSTRRSLLHLNNLANQHQLQLLPYFEMKAQFNQLLEEQRKRVHRLEENVLKIKMSYADALHNLEEISDEIHEKRKNQKNEIPFAEQNDGTQSPNCGWNGITINHHQFKTRSNSCEDIFEKSLCSEDMYMSLPSQLKGRSFNRKLQGIRENSSHLVRTLQEPSLPKELETLKKNYEQITPKSNLVEEPITDTAINTLLKDVEHDGIPNTLSSHLKKLNFKESPYSNHDPLEEDYHSPELDEISNHKFLAPDYNVLRVQREEISDSESLASNDTVDTLDDNQIECLLLDKVMPLEVKSALHSEEG